MPAPTPVQIPKKCMLMKGLAPAPRPKKLKIYACPKLKKALSPLKD